MFLRSDSRTEWELLEEAIRIASSLRRTLEDAHISPTHRPSPNLSQLEALIPELVLPFPHEMLSEIASLQIPVKVHESILQSFRSWFLQVQQEYASSYKRTCLEISRTGSTFGPSFADIHRVYQACSERHFFPMVKEYVSIVLAKLADYRKSDAAEERRSFNSEYTPVLEKYFEYNAYPSVQHQTLLAEKSMMTRRQIEVWFQNHRNRTKKDEGTLRRNTTDLPLRIALDFPQKKSFPAVGRTPSPSDEDFAIENPDEENYQTYEPTSCIDTFDSFRPPHAFPNAFPPSVPDPFSGDNRGISFPPPTWTRRPASSVPSYMHSSIDMDELARMFHAKLNIFESVRKRTVSPKTSEVRTAWYTATVTIAPQAPLPAFVRNLSRSSPTIFSHSSSIFSSRLPSNSRSTTTANAFLSPRQETTHARKMSPLPRRLPASSNATSTPSPNQSASHMSSFSSQSSSRSRSSSSSSRSGTPEPTTPPQLPTWNIPIEQYLPNDYDINFGTLFGDDRDGFTSMPSGSLGMPQSVYPAAGKQLAPPAFNFGSLITPLGCIQAQS